MFIRVSRIVFVALALFLFTFWMSRSVLFLSILCLALVASKTFFSRSRNRVSKIDYILILHAFFAFPAAFIYMDIEMYIKIVVIPLVLFFLSRNLKVNEQSLKSLLLVTIASFTVIAVILLFQKEYRIFEFSISQILDRNRFLGYYLVSDLALGPNILSIALSVIAVASYSLSFSYTKLKRFSLLLIMLVTMFLIMIVSSRTISAALIFVLFLNQFISKQGRWVYAAIIPRLIILLIGMLMFIMAIFPYLPDNFIERYAVIISFSPDDSLLTRFSLWDSAFSVFANNPIFGVGYSMMYEQSGMTTHNEMLAHFVGGGMFTGLLVAVLFLNIIKDAFKAVTLVNLQYLFYVRFILGFILLVCFLGLTENYSYSYSAVFYPVIWVFLGLFYSLYDDQCYAMTRIGEKKRVSNS